MIPWLLFGARIPISEVTSHEEQCRRGDYTITNKLRSRIVRLNHASQNLRRLLQLRKNPNRVQAGCFVFNLEKWSLRKRLLDIEADYSSLIRMLSNLRITIKLRNKDRINPSIREMQCLFARNPNLKLVRYGIQTISPIQRQCYMMDRSTMFQPRTSFVKSKVHIKKSKILNTRWNLFMILKPMGLIYLVFGLALKMILLFGQSTARPTTSTFPLFSSS